MAAQGGLNRVGRVSEQVGNGGLAEQGWQSKVGTAGVAKLVWQSRVGVAGLEEQGWQSKVGSGGLAEESKVGKSRVGKGGLVKQDGRTDEHQTCVTVGRPTVVHQSDGRTAGRPGGQAPRSPLDNQAPPVPACPTRRRTEHRVIELGSRGTKKKVGGGGAEHRRQGSACRTQTAFQEDEASIAGLRVFFLKTVVAFVDIEPYPHCRLDTERDSAKPIARRDRNMAEADPSSSKRWSASSTMTTSTEPQRFRKTTLPKQEPKAPKNPTKKRKKKQENATRKKKQDENGAQTRLDSLTAQKKKAREESAAKKEKN